LLNWHACDDDVVYDSGTLFDVGILDITDDDIRSRFLEVIYVH